MIVHAEQIRGTIQAPPSKSALHRRLILNRIAGFCDVPTDLCSDVRTTVDCLARLETDAMLDCGECGAALRFLLPVCLLFGGGTFTGSEALMQRPVEPLLSVLKSHGASLSSDRLPLEIRGPLSPGIYQPDGSISSQFSSGLLLTLPFLSCTSTLLLTGSQASLGYIHMTERMLTEHGIRLEAIENGYRIPGGQTARRLPLAVEGDWSSAAAMLILGAISGCVTVSGLASDSVQPDRRILDVLDQCGAQISIRADSVTVSKSRLSGFKCSGSESPDLIPVLAALACACEGDSVLYRLERLKYKESDRFLAVCRLLDSLGADFETERSDTIVIHGSGSIRGGEADIPADHRMVMAAALMSACSTRPVSIPSADCVQKSYPAFFEDFCSLGGKIHAV